jgi:hypothetical protein
VDRKTGMSDPIGYRRWAIAEGHLSDDDAETACILNASADDAHIVLTVFFADRAPCGPYRLTVPALRTLHMRYAELAEPEPIPHDTDYSSVIESDVPVVVQHSRADTSTIAYAGD